jgi:hypothetical protein
MLNSLIFEFSEFSTVLCLGPLAINFGWPAFKLCGPLLTVKVESRSLLRVKGASRPLWTAKVASGPLLTAKMERGVVIEMSPASMVQAFLNH